jgi:hypothetical protein
MLEHNTPTCITTLGFLSTAPFDEEASLLREGLEHLIFETYGTGSGELTKLSFICPGGTIVLLHVVLTKRTTRLIRVAVPALLLDALGRESRPLRWERGLLLFDLMPMEGNTVFRTLLHARCLHESLLEFFSSIIVPWLTDDFEYRPIGEAPSAEKPVQGCPREASSADPAPRQAHTELHPNAARDAEIRRLRFEEGLSAKEIAQRIKRLGAETGWQHVGQERVEQIYRSDPGYTSPAKRNVDNGKSQKA